jgi:hypothetical protein
MTQVFDLCVSLFCFCLFSVFPFRHPFARIFDWSEDTAFFLPAVTPSNNDLYVF